jgi:hypothetical protein
MGDHAGVLFQPILSVVSKMKLNHVSKKSADHTKVDVDKFVDKSTVNT